MASLDIQWIDSFCLWIIYTDLHRRWKKSTGKCKSIKFLVRARACVRVIERVKQTRGLEDGWCFVNGLACRCIAERQFYYFTVGSDGEGVSAGKLCRKSCAEVDSFTAISQPSSHGAPLFVFQSMKAFQPWLYEPTTQPTQNKTLITFIIFAIVYAIGCLITICFRKM